MKVSVFALIGALCLTGCVTTDQKIGEIDQQLHESEQVYATAIVEVLESDPNPSKESQAATVLAKELQDLEGKPAPDDRLDPKEVVRDPKGAIEGRVEKDYEARADKEAYERELIEAGTKWEEQHRKTMWQRIWAWSIGTLGIGGMIALCVFVPPALPIILNVLGWVAQSLIRAVPPLMHFFGVVGKATYENVVKGVGDARFKIKALEEHSPEKTFTPGEVRQLLDDALKSTTADDTAVSEYVRKKYNV